MEKSTEKLLKELLASNRKLAADFAAAVSYGDIHPEDPAAELIAEFIDDVNAAFKQFESSVTDSNGE